MIEFHYHGFYIRVLAEANVKDSAWIIEQLRQDFSSFLGTNEGLNLEIQLVSYLVKPKFYLKLFSSKLVRRFASSSGPYYEGHGQFKALASKDPLGKKIFKVTGNDRQFIYEVIYAYILSTAGEALEVRGFHRIHGLGLSTDQKSLVIPLTSGQGKSTACDWLLKNTDLKFLGDETIFTNGLSVFAFPIRRAIREKDFALLDSQEGRLLNRIFFEKKYLFSWAQGRIKTSDDKFNIVLFKNTFSFTKFAWSFFWGLGNAQMAEFLIRVDNLHLLAYIAIGRIKCLLRLRKHILYLDRWEKSPELNWKNLKTLL